MVAGESSGDLHAASLIDALRRRAPGTQVCGVGGDRMASAGMDLLYHQRHLAVVGITEVIRHLGDVRRAMRKLVGAVKERQIDAAVLVDYPDFNMTLARRLRRMQPGLPIVYYISPQVWAWRPGRVRTMKRLVDRMLVILPFEADLYESARVPVQFVGHPLLDAVPAAGDRGEFARRHGLDANCTWIGLLPGSRRAEVEGLLPSMLGAAEILRQRGDYRFLVPRAAGLEAVVYESCLRQAPAALRKRVEVISDDYYELARHSRAAIVCSGTATLETALVGTPEVVVYRTSWLTYNLGKLLVRINDIALVNVIAGHRGVPELLQSEVTPARIVAEILPLLEDGRRRRECVRFLRDVRARLGRPGASDRAAAAVLAVVGVAAQSPSPVVAAPASGS